MASPAQERLIRLCGDGKGKGGGLPLPLGFMAVVNTLLDNGPQPLDTLVKPVEEAVWKPSRVHAPDMYPDTSYRGLTEDLLDQLNASNLVAREDGQWRVTAKLLNNLGKPLSIIPKPADHKGTFYLKEDRERVNTNQFEAREKNSAEHQLRNIYNELQSDRPFHVKLQKGRGAPVLTRLTLHPLAHSLPKLKEREFVALGRNIRQYGVLMPIKLLGGQVVDGRHRAAIASALDIPVRADEIGEDEAYDIVWSLNLERRHLTDIQLAVLYTERWYPKAKEEAKERQQEGGGRGRESRYAGLGGNPPKPGRAPKATKLVADKTNGVVKEDRVKKALVIMQAPDTLERVRRGDPELDNITKAWRAALEELGKDRDHEARPRIRNARENMIEGKNRFIKSAREIAAAIDIPEGDRADYREWVKEVRQVADELERRLSVMDATDAPTWKAP